MRGLSGLFAIVVLASTVSSADTVLVPQLGHAGFVESASLSPDGRFIVTGGWDGTVRLWHAETGYELRRLVEPAQGGWLDIVSTEFSPDGKRLLFASSRQMGVLEMEGNRFRWNVPNYGGPRNPVFAANGSLIFSCQGMASNSPDSQVSMKLLNVSDGSMKTSIKVAASILGNAAFPICAVTSDGQFGAIGLRGPGHKAKAFELWDLENERLIASFSGAGSGLQALAFSPSGQRLVAVTEDNEALVWDRAHPEKPRRIAEDAATALFLGNEEEIALVRLIGITKEGYARPYKEARLVRFDLRRDQETATAPHGSVYPQATLSYRNGALLSIRRTYVDHWSVRSWQKIRTLSNSDLGEVESISVTDDERFLLVVFRGDPYEPRGYLLDLEGGELIREVRLGERGLKFVLDPGGRFTAEGQWAREISSGTTLSKTAVEWGNPQQAKVGNGLVLALSHDRVIAIWDPVEPKMVWSWSPPLVDPTEPPVDGVRPPLDIQIAAVSPNRQVVATAGIRTKPDGSHDLSVRLWNPFTGQLTHKLERGGGWVKDLEFSADGSRLLVAGADVGIWDVATGKRLSQYASDRELVSSARFAPSQETVIVATHDGPVVLWDPSSNTTRKRFSGHLGGATAAVMLEKRQLIVSGGNDKVLRFWDLRSDRDPMTLAVRGPGQWAVIDSVGRFDAPVEAGDVAVWVVKDEPIALNQLTSRYYTPRLFSKFLTNDRTELRDVSMFEDPELFPAVETRALPDGRLEITLTDRGGGIGAVPVHINGRELTADAWKLLPENAKQKVVEGKLRLTVNVRGDPRLMATAENVIDVFAFEKDNYLRSRNKGVRISSVTRAPQEKTKPRLWVVAAGVSDYFATELKLNYAAKDAVDMASALAIAGNAMFGTEGTTISLLSTGQKDPELLPTRGNLMSALKRLLRSSHDDVVIVYLSGHGLGRGNEKGEYYFLTAEAGSGGFWDPAVRGKTSISGDELAEIMRNVPANKRVVILDTCSAGSFVNAFGKSRDVSDGQSRALRRLHERTGFHILAGAPADQPSWEASPYSQGLLTYCLLFGMRGGALDRDRFINVLDLFDFAARQVPLLAGDIRGNQRPLLSSPGGGVNFPIGQVSEADAAKIPLQELRPVFVET